MTATMTLEPMLDSHKERIATYIDDAIALEASAITTLKDMIEDAIDPQDAALYREHLMETERQKAQLEERLSFFGREAGRNVFKDLINKAGAIATDMLHAAKNQHDKATRNLMQAYSIENLEVAVYEALYAAADEAGDHETARLARSIQAEEKATAEKIWSRIEISSRAAINAVE
jgi:ferritin-like metal-binding protein YciE